MLQESLHTWLCVAALAAALAASSILAWYLRFRPPLVGSTRVLLLLGLGVLPAGASLTGSLAAVRVSQKRAFCGSCHTMAPFAADAADPASTSLAALHSRNRAHGSDSCNDCHRDYQTFGGVATKLAGMRHLWSALRRPTDAGPPRLYRPFRQDNCRQCHSGSLPGFLDEPEHAVVADDLRRSAIDCTSAGCHGPAHPTTKAPR